MIYISNEDCYFTVRELLPELLTQLVGLLVDDESGDSQEVSRSLNMLVIECCLLQLRPRLGPSAKCVGSLAKGFWEKSSQSFGLSPLLRITVLERVYVSLYAILCEC